MTLTIIVIILELFLVAIVVAVCHYYRSDSMLRKNKAQQIQTNDRDANFDSNASYSGQQVETGNREYREYNSFFAIAEEAQKEEDFADDDYSKND